MQQQTPHPLTPSETEDLSTIEAITRAKARHRQAWLMAFFSPWRFMSWLNPTNGIALAAIALPIGTILSAALIGVVPEGMRIISDMISVSIIGGGFIFAAVTIVPFTIWEAFKHYQEWKQAHAQESTKPPHYGHYLFAIPKQIGQWAVKHPGQAFVMVLGLVITNLLIGFGIGFFMGSNISISVFSPVVNRIPAMLYWGLHGLGQVPGLSFLNPDLLSSASEIGSVWVTLQTIAIVLLVATPLIIADMIRRAAQTAYEARQAGGKLVGGKGEGFDLRLENEPDRRVYIELKNSFRKVFLSEVVPLTKFTDNIENDSKLPQASYYVPPQ